jgi:hypothetical protein
MQGLLICGQFEMTPRTSISARKSIWSPGRLGAPTKVAHVKEDRVAGAYQTDDPASSARPAMEKWAAVRHRHRQGGEHRQAEAGMTWGLLATYHLPDGRRRMQLLADAGVPVTFTTEAEAQAAAERMASIPDVELRPTPLDAPHRG